MKPLFLLLSITASLASQTLVSDTIVIPTTSDFPDGFCVIEAAMDFTASSGFRVTRTPVTVYFKNGLLNVSLYSTLDATFVGASSDGLRVPHYIAKCGWMAQALNGHEIKGYTWVPPHIWLIPPSTDPVSLKDIEVAIKLPWTRVSDVLWLSLNIASWATLSN